MGLIDKLWFQFRNLYRSTITSRVFGTHKPHFIRHSDLVLSANLSNDSRYWH